MRIFSFFLCLISAVSLLADNLQPYTIEGKIGNEDEPSMIYMIYRDANFNTVEDSCAMKQGRFAFAGNTEYPFYAELFITRNGVKALASQDDMLGLYVEPGKITVQSPDYLSRAVITGSEMNDLEREFREHLAPIQLKADSISQCFSSASPERQSDPLFTDSLNMRFDEISNEFYNAAMSFIGGHPDSMLSVYLLQAQMDSQPNDQNVETVFNMLNENLRLTPPGRRLEATIRMYKTLDLGVKAPDFTVADVNGNPVSLSALRGKYVFLVFWSPTCHHCLGEVPTLRKSHELYKDKGYEIISFALENEANKQEWLDAVRDNNMYWPNVSDLKEWDSETFQAYKAYSVPKNYLIDPSGKIVAKELYGANLLRTLESLLGQE